MINTDETREQIKPLQWMHLVLNLFRKIYSTVRSFALDGVTRAVCCTYRGLRSKKLPKDCDTR